MSVLMKLSAFFFSILLLLTSFAVEKEVLQDKFKTYQLNPNIYGEKKTHIVPLENETVIIFSPLLDSVVVRSKPYPSKVQQALAEPGTFFYESLNKGVNDFRFFSKEYVKCIQSNLGSKKVSCTQKFEVCNGENNGILCNWDTHETIGRCGKISRKDLVRCFEENLKVFDSFNKCFQPRTTLYFTFEVFGSDARLRSYYTLESRYINNETDEKISCRFTVTPGSPTRYSLIEISNAELDRPQISSIPLGLYVKDHYNDLLELQKTELSKEKRVKKP